MRVSNVKMIEMTDNYFGFPIELPLVLLSYQRGSGACREPVTLSDVQKIEFSRNMAVKADWTLVELDHSFNKDLGQEKVVLDRTFLLLPCQCEGIKVNNNTENVSHLRPLYPPHSSHCRSDCSAGRCRLPSVTTRVRW